MNQGLSLIKFLLYEGFACSDLYCVYIWRLFLCSKKLLFCVFMRSANLTVYVGFIAAICFAIYSSYKSAS